MVYLKPNEIKNLVGNIRGVLHVGAHLAEEHELYNAAEIHHRVWIESNPRLVTILNNKFKNEQNDIVICATISEKDNEEVTFNIANNGQSSSILNFKTHAEHYRDIKFVDSYTTKTTSLSTILDGLENSELLDLLNLDIQGVELRAIKGLGEKLKQFKAVYTEVNLQELYEKCDLVQQIDDYLFEMGFIKQGQFICNEGWGDALYIRRNI